MRETNGKKKCIGIVKVALIIASCFVILFASNFINKKVTFADSGYDFSYDSGSSSYDSGSSYSGSSYSSSYSSSSYDGDADGGSLFLAIIIVVIIIIVIAAKSKGTPTTTTAPKSSYVANVNDENVVNKVKELIPDFNKDEFIKEGYQIYLDVQDAWTNFKLESVRDKISDEMFNMYQSQLSTMEIKGEQNIMRDFTKQTAYLKDVVKQNDNITITATYVIDFYDYIVEKSTGKVLRGSASTKMRVTYDMKFRKTLDASKVVDHCPNCGAKIDKINGAGVCEYCGSKVVSENAKWILTDKKNIGQTRA